MDTLIDGMVASSVSALDRGLQYGDGLFETITCVDGEPRWLSQHLARLRHGCERLGLPFTAIESLPGEIRELCRTRARCIVKVIVTRGPATARGYRPTGLEVPTRIVSRHDWPTASTASGRVPGAAGEGYRVGMSAVRLGKNPLLAGLKHLNRLEQVLAQRALADSTFDEVLMCSSSGEVVCASSANIFLVDGDGLFTPALEDCGVAGVMRRVVLDASIARSRPIAVRPVAIAELARVREMFLTNVRLGLQTVRWFNGRELRQDSEARGLQELIHATHC